MGSDGNLIGQGDSYNLDKSRDDFSPRSTNSQGFQTVPAADWCRIERKRRCTNSPATPLESLGPIRLKSVMGLTVLAVETV